MDSQEFKFELGDRVALAESDEAGTVVGRAEYLHTMPQYYVRYGGNDLTIRKDWFFAEDMRKIESDGDGFG